MQSLNCPMAPVSWGELIDKITILSIKAERLGGKALSNVETELRMLEEVAEPVRRHPAMSGLCDRLRGVNEALWEIEDKIRLKEAEADFGPDFIALARSVYKQNDLRAALKREINLSLGSHLIEEKSYATQPIFFRAEREARSAHVPVVKSSER
jgi:Family of unknown function (DUF6165)